LKIEDGKRTDFKAYLEKHEIPSMIYYSIPLHLQKAYRRPGFGEGSFPVTEKLSASVISLPIHTEMNDEQLNYICSTIGNYFHD
jgi:dTDP-4-amino-4,6-dideoxygalactose transaminase